MASLCTVRNTSEVLLAAALADKDNHYLMYCYQIICQIAKKLLSRDGEFISDGLYKYHSVRVCLVSKSYNQHANIK